MECAYACYCDDGDIADCVRTKMVRARREHKCCECDRVIERGEEHEHVRGLWEGYWESYRTCLGCMRLRDDLCRRGYCFGGLAQVVLDCLGVNIIDGSVRDG